MSATAIWQRCGAFLLQPPIVKVGWFLLLTVALLPPFVLLALQGMGIGTGTAIAGTVQFSDALGWIDCASLAATGHFDALARSDWCMRRPEVSFLSLPLVLLASGSVANLVVLQSLLLALAWVSLAVVVVRTLHVAPLLVAGTLLVVSWMSLRYAMSTGAECISLTLAVFSLCAFLLLMSKRSIAWGVLAIVLAAFALRARPGNPLLVLGLTFLVAHLMAERLRTRTAVFLSTLSLFTGLFLISSTLHAFGLENAGHGGNFWATAYAAADPVSESFKSGYSTCAAVGLTRELDCWAYLRSRTFELIVENPRPFLEQLLRNSVQFFASGPFARVFGPEVGSGFPRSLADIVTELRSAHALPFVANLLLALLSPIVFVALTIRLIRERPEPSKGFSLRAVRSAHPRWLLLGWALVAWVGAALVFAVVGHDEGRRHLIMSAPVLWLALLLVVTRPIDDARPPLVAPVRLISAGCVLASGIVLALLWLSSTRPTVLSIRGDCDAPTSFSVPYEVVAFAPLDTPHRLMTPTSGRVREGRRPRWLLGSRDGYKPHIDLLPSGALVSVWSKEEGRTRSAFVSESVLSRVLSSADALPLCFGPGPEEGKPRVLGLPSLKLFESAPQLQP